MSNLVMVVYGLGAVVAPGPGVRQLPPEQGDPRHQGQGQGQAEGECQEGQHLGVEVSSNQFSQSFLTDSPPISPQQSDRLD